MSMVAGIYQSFTPEALAKSLRTLEPIGFFEPEKNRILRNFPFTRALATGTFPLLEPQPLVRIGHSSVGERRPIVRSNGSRPKAGIRIRRRWASKSRVCTEETTNLARSEYVAHHVAGDVGRAEFLAQLIKRPTIIVGDGNDVTHRPTHSWQLPLQHDRLAVADQ